MEPGLALEEVAGGVLGRVRDAEVGASPDPGAAIEVEGAFDGGDGGGGPPLAAEAGGDAGGVGALAAGELDVDEAVGVAGEADDEARGGELDEVVDVVEGVVEPEPVDVGVELAAEEGAVGEAGVHVLADDDELTRAGLVGALAEVEAEVAVVLAGPDEEQVVVDDLGGRGGAVDDGAREVARRAEGEVGGGLDPVRAEGLAGGAVTLAEEGEEPLDGGGGDEGVEVGGGPGG